MMSIEVMPLGGMDEVGRNMMVVSFGDSKVIVDMGLKLERILRASDSSVSKLDQKELVEMGGIPDDSEVDPDDVKAILFTHGHLDHIGAVGKLAHRYDAPIYATPFTAELVESIIKNDRVFDVDNDVHEVDLGESAQVEDLEVEFIRGAHSIPQNSFPAVHSSEGVVLCVGGFKLDEDSALSCSNDFESLKKLSNSGPVVSLICSVKADSPDPTPPESRAHEMLEDVMAEASDRGKGLLVSSFSSHIARIRAIVRISYEVGRMPIVLGRSLKKKCKVASRLGLVDFPSDLKVLGHITTIREALEKISESREDYVIITTGHQGEPHAILSRIADEKEPYEIEEGDEVIFSASVVPNPINVANREFLEAKLKSQGAKIHRDVHVSGHAGKPGTKEMIEKVGPDHLIPYHGTTEKMKSVLRIGRKIGYSEDQLHFVKNREKLSLGG